MRLPTFLSLVAFAFASGLLCFSSGAGCASNQDTTDETPAPSGKDAGSDARAGAGGSSSCATNKCAANKECAGGVPINCTCGVSVSETCVSGCCVDTLEACKAACANVGGAGGKAGSGSGGKGGSAGKAGSAGAAAGSAGESGAAGEAGAAGESGAAGSAGEQAAGSGGSAGAAGSGNGPGLIFSEYVEGSGSPTFTKALEIFNPTGEAVDLATCKIAMYQNGSATVTANIALDGFQLQPGAVFVLCHTTITSAANCNQKDSNLTFNGNDAVELNCSNQTVDMVGTAGDVVGAAWGDLTVATEDMTLRRQCSVTSGHKSPTDAFDTAEWQPFPKDDVSGLGVRSCPDTP